MIVVQHRARKFTAWRLTDGERGECCFHAAIARRLADIEAFSKPLSIRFGPARALIIRHPFLAES